MSIQITEHDAGTLNEQAGIVAGRLTQYADALDTTPAAVVDGIDVAGVEITGDLESPTDTDQRKGQETHERPGGPRAPVSGHEPGGLRPRARAGVDW